MMNEMIERANLIASKGICAYTYKVNANEWEGYGKKRTYISIVETCTGTKHYKKYDCGYVDMNTNEYVAGKNVDLRDNYTLDGSRF